MYVPASAELVVEIEKVLVDPVNVINEGRNEPLDKVAT